MIENIQNEKHQLIYTWKQIEAIRLVMNFYVDVKWGEKQTKKKLEDVMASDMRKIMMSWDRR